ncbi:hypothetical protein [Oligoflexus tunisiensis]|uniref:hypothetical protein n=1 Tax=Oligoflexus tunisiensis TaxID=708132 RepID=UPI00114D140D|nr:hypothetical protein [Oligoflexus tunisiensis]
MKAMLMALMLMAGSGAVSAAPDQQMFRALVDGRACIATVFSGNEILLPNHCVSEPYENVSLENIGSKKIESVRDFSEDARSDLFQTSERLLIVRLNENVFGEGRHITMKSPHLGFLDGELKKRCRVAYIESAMGFMAYHCPSWHGQSGRLLSQDGVPVGIHLGRLKSSGLAIAALEKGPIIDLNAVFGNDFEPEKLKVSCCKKLKKAVDKVGQAIQDGVDSVGKVIENIKGEIKRLEDDVKSLPKVFSTDYLEEKTASIKGPKLPEFKVSNVKWPEMSLNFVGIPERWFKKAGKRWDQAIYMFKELGRAAEVWWEIIADTKVGTPNLCQGCPDPAPRDICAPSATELEKRECISNFEKAIEIANLQKIQTVKGLRPWLNDQKARVGVE